MTNTVTVFGGSGFVGRYIVRRLVAQGMRVRVAVRNPKNARFLTAQAEQGQVEAVECNIRRDEHVADAVHGAQAVVNCVGTFDMHGLNNFDAIQDQAATRISRLASQHGVETMVHLSSIGADLDAASIYSQTKAKGEQGVLQHTPGAMILRPSVIFGAEDAFFNRFASLAKLGPVLPLVGADTKFQPVYVDNVAQAAVLGVTQQVAGGIYELGGPDVRSFRALMAVMLQQIDRKRTILDIPLPLARVMAVGMEAVQTLSGGLIAAQITRDQVRSLARDNIVSEGAKTLADLGIEATRLEDVLPEYLWTYRPDGKYTSPSSEPGKATAD